MLDVIEIWKQIISYVRRKNCHYIYRGKGEAEAITLVEVGRRGQKESAGAYDAIRRPTCVQTCCKVVVCVIIYQLRTGWLLRYAWTGYPSLPPWASCQIRKIAGAHAPGMPGTFSPSPQVSDPDMHHGTCVTHVPWCMPGSLTIGFLWNRRRGKTFPAFPAHAQPAILRIW